MARNFTIGLGMCSPGQWQKLSKPTWTKSMSPYEDRILDIRTPLNLSRKIEVSTEEGNSQHISKFSNINHVLGFQLIWLSSLPVMCSSFCFSEFLPHRLIFLVLGAVMMVAAHTLSESVVFYYGGAMTLGIIVVVLIILFQVPIKSTLVSIILIL